MEDREIVVEETLKKYPSDIVDLLFGYRKSQVLFTAIELGIFDLCTKGVTAKNIAESRSLDLPKCERFLNALVSLKLLRKEYGDDKGSVYQNTETTQKQLTSSSACSMTSFIKHEQLWSLSVPGLTENLKLGNSGSYAAGASKALETGMTESEYEDLWIRSNTWKASIAGDAIAAAFDLSRFETACDLGGGPGEIAFKIAKRYPQMNIQVMEQAGNIDQLKRMKPSWVGSEAERVTLIPGNFMTDKLPKADLYITAHVNVMFPNEEVLLLWKKIFQALPPGGGFLICERLMDDGCSKQHMINMADMLYLALNYPNGRERPLSEFKKLLADSGFIMTGVRQFPKYIGYDVILATKP